MLESAGRSLRGLTTVECRSLVLKKLKEQGLLRGEKIFSMRWRIVISVGAVIELMLKAQWFIDVERLAKGRLRDWKKVRLSFIRRIRKKC